MIEVCKACVNGELFESFKAKTSQGLPAAPATATTGHAPNNRILVEESKSHEIDFKANLRKVKKKDDVEGEREEKGEVQTDFKAQLKKTAVAVKEAPNEKSPDNNNGNVDFKARLRKVSGTINTAAPAEKVGFFSIYQEDATVRQRT